MLGIHFGIDECAVPWIAHHMEDPNESDTALSLRGSS